MNESYSFLQKIVHDIQNKKNKGEQSIYLDRIIQNLSKYRVEANKSLQQEILEEIAYSLRKAEINLNLALYECEKIYQEYLITSNNDDIVKRYEEARKKALNEKWKYMVQRESLGLIWTEDLEKMYPNPKPLKD
jgi:signal recognition particle GTPase